MSQFPSKIQKYLVKGQSFGIYDFFIYHISATKKSGNPNFENYEKPLLTCP